MQTDRRWPFCWPSLLSFVGQTQYSNLSESLIKAIHIWNLEEIRFNEIRVTTKCKLIGGGHFVGHLGYRS